MSNAEARRIIDITSDPSITDQDYFVIDGEQGTRKVPSANLIVKQGTTAPDPDMGVVGMLYLKMNGVDVEKVYCKIDPTTWLQIIPGSYSPTPSSVSEMTWGEVSEYTWGDISNLVW